MSIDRLLIFLLFLVAC